MYLCNKKVLYDLPEVFEDFLRAYAGLLVEVYKDSCLSRARTKTTMNAFRGTFTCISHWSRSRRIGSLEKCTATFSPSKCTGTFRAIPADFAGICRCRRSNLVDVYEYTSCSYVVDTYEYASRVVSSGTPPIYHILEKCTATFFLSTHV